MKRSMPGAAAMDGPGRRRIDRTATRVAARDARMRADATRNVAPFPRTGAWGRRTMDQPRQGGRGRSDTRDGGRPRTRAMGYPVATWGVFRGLSPRPVEPVAVVWTGAGGRSGECRRIDARVRR